MSYSFIDKIFCFLSYSEIIKEILHLCRAPDKGIKLYFPVKPVLTGFHSNFIYSYIIVFTTSLTLNPAKCAGIGLTYICHMFNYGHCVLYEG